MNRKTKGKITKEELFKMDAVEVYKIVLEGKDVKRFPSGFWQSSQAKQNASKCTRYLIEEILKYENEEEVKENLSAKLFKKHKLSGMLMKCFRDSPYEAINNAYPDKYKEWEFKQVPMSYWGNKDNGIKATRWLIEEKLKFSEEDIKDKLNFKLFKKNGLIGMLQHCFDKSIYNAINHTYPNKFREWELNQVSNGFWSDKNAVKESIIWLIEEKLNLSDDELRLQLSTKLFRENGLGGMLERCFNGSPYNAINYAYPNKFKQWEFKQTSKGYWKNKENAINATRWLIEEKLKLSEAEVKKIVGQRLFVEHGLSGMLQYCFNGSPYEAINAAYPNKYREWEFKYVPMRYWQNKENGIKATRWLIEEKLCLNDEEIKCQVSQSFFIKNGLSGMLQHCFNGNSYEAINAAYPNKYKKSDFRGYKK